MTYIHKGTGQYPVTEQEIRIANQNTSFPVPFIAPDEYALVFPFPLPTYNSITERVVETSPELTVLGTYEQRWQVLPLDQEQASLNAARAASEATDLVNKKIEALWKAADTYVSGYISGIAIGILTIGVLQQKPKSLAVTNWSSSVWTEYYTRKALVTPTSIDNHDFSSFGKMPYSVPELQEEIGIV